MHCRPAPRGRSWLTRDAPKAGRRERTLLSRIRILVAGLPRLLRDILERAIRAAPDLELVSPDDDGDLPGAVTHEHPDVIVVVEEDADLSVARLAQVSPASRLGLMTVTRGGRRVRLIDVRQVSVHDTSPQGLVEAIRAEFSHQERS